MHHRGRLKLLVFRPKHEVALHPSLKFRSPSRLRHQDQALRYSFSVNTSNFRHPYKPRKLNHGPTLFRVRLLFSANLALLADAEAQELQLQLRLSCREQVRELNMQVIFRYQYQPEPISDVDLKAHLLRLQPFQSGLREAARQWHQLRHQVLYASSQSFAITSEPYLFVIFHNESELKLLLELIRGRDKPNDGSYRFFWNM
ncbi:unannotated protein [freshwater metagenome]|uniref:Unannotated protein n=1 Tax=freshwater metagenome TaxID=449393 RepID=A0A6J6T740_9ZZZZ